MSSHNLTISIDPHAIGLIWEQNTKRPLGTGFVFLKANLIVTAKHVVFDDWDNPRHIVFGSKGKGFEPSFIRPHPDIDIVAIELATDSSCRKPLYPSYVGFTGKRGLFAAGYRPSLTAMTFAEPPTIEVNHIESFEIETRERVSGVEERILFKPGFVERGSSGGPILGAGGSVVGVIVEDHSNPVSTPGASERAHATSILALLGERWSGEI